jgi:hypothetical protein
MSGGKYVRESKSNRVESMPSARWAGRHDFGGVGVLGRRSSRATQSKADSRWTDVEQLSSKGGRGDGRGCFETAEGLDGVRGEKGGVSQ